MPTEKLRRRSWTYRFGLGLTAAGLWNGLAALWPTIVAIPGVPVWLLGVGAAVLALRERTTEPLAPLVRRSTTVPLVLLGLALSLSSCASPGGGTGVGVVASATAGPIGARPAVLFRFDGNTFVAWGNADYAAELFIQASGLPLMSRSGVAGVAVVGTIDTKFSWDGRLGDPLPYQAASLFRPAEIDVWGLTFDAPTVSP